MAFDVAETASLVNESRARRVELSGDRFASLWVSESSRELWESFAREVYPLDDLELSLRHRFYLDNLNAFLSEHDDARFVNLGAGFTSYPFLTSRTCPCLEVDQSSVIEHKRARVAAFQVKGSMPKHEQLEWLPADFSDPRDVATLRERLGSFCASAPAVVQLEGVSYYLPRQVLDGVLALVRESISSGSLFVFDYWTSAMADFPVPRRFKAFLNRRTDEPIESFTTIETAEVARLQGFELIELTTIQLLERRYADSRELADPDNVFPEIYAVLKRV